MSRAKFWAALTLIGTLAATPTLAQGVLYDCDITNRDARVGWITQKYAFVVRPQGVDVVDGVVLAFNDGPMRARTRARGDTLNLSWTVRAQDSSKNVARMSYRAQLNQSAKTVTVRVTPVGYPQGWAGSGTCKTRTP